MGKPSALGSEKSTPRVRDLAASKPSALSSEKSTARVGDLPAQLPVPEPSATSSGTILMSQLIQD